MELYSFFNVLMIFNELWMKNHFVIMMDWLINENHNYCLYFLKIESFKNYLNSILYDIIILIIITWLLLLIILFLNYIYIHSLIPSILQISSFFIIYYIVLSITKKWCFLVEILLSLLFLTNHYLSVGI